MAADEILWKHVVLTGDDTHLFEGLFEVSNDGQVRNYKNEILLHNKIKGIRYPQVTLLGRLAIKPVNKNDNNDTLNMNDDDKVNDPEVENDVMNQEAQDEVGDAIQVDIQITPDQILDEPVKKKKSRRKYKKRFFQIGELVAHAFLGCQPAGSEIEHIDGNKKNNNVTNLKYITRREILERKAKNKVEAKAKRKKIQKAKKLVESKATEYNEENVCDIPSFSKYCINKEGDVYNKRTTKNVKTIQSSTGLKINLSRDVKSRDGSYIHSTSDNRKFDISSLLCLAYHGDPNEDNISDNSLPDVIHINGDSTDNRIENLQWSAKSTVTIETPQIVDQNDTNDTDTEDDYTLNKLRPIPKKIK
ncbi:MAG: hypothetical protein Harvfovirus44_7 [Harvfovirus sp.]|uniref:HNH nuclease domain-containing protein n=1 Tax=Harvfovirus sp. TaxID=2487768 RepID=A0A3G5A897_9VIRU|nr:MAG: hypothetical protein Harvfovirus44_7 [Harvfovirus sp.]